MSTRPSRRQLEFLVTETAAWRPVLLGIQAYLMPLIALVVATCFVRVLFARRWVDAVVFSLHVEAVSLVLSLPAMAVLARFGPLSVWLLLVILLGLWSAALVWLYGLFALHRAFGDVPIWAWLCWAWGGFFMSEVLAAVPGFWMDFLLSLWIQSRM